MLCVIVRRTLKGGKCRFPSVTKYHPALSAAMRVVETLHPFLMFTEEHRKAFLELPFVALRSYRNLKDILSC